MAERILQSLPPFRFILEYHTANARKEMEDGQLTDKVDVIPEAIRLEAPSVKPILTYRQIRRLPSGVDMTEEVAHRAYGEIRKGGRAMAVTLDTSLETHARVELTKTQQAFFTNYTEMDFKFYRRVAKRDQVKRADAPTGTTGEHTR